MNKRIDIRMRAVLAPCTGNGQAPPSRPTGMEGGARLS